MNSLDLIGMAFKNLWRRKVRTILTVLGVIVGTASIIVMLSLGIGMNESFKQQVSMMGSLNIINIDTYYYPEMEEKAVSTRSSRQQNQTLDDKILAKIAAIDGVEAVTPLLTTYIKFESGKYISHMQLVGINAGSMDAFGFKLQQGRILNENDSNSVVFGSNIKDTFYDPKSRNWYNREQPNIDVFNDKITISFDMGWSDKPNNTGNRSLRDRNKGQNIEVVGLLEPGQNEKDYSAYMNVEHLKKLIQANSRNNQNSGRIQYGVSNNNKSGYERAMVKVKDLKDVERIQAAIKEMGFGAYSLTDILRQMLDATKTIRTILGAIGAVALFIAAIGITNTMVMSIYERTREIGIMKVLGCVLGDIRRVFLLESAMIGFLGGLAGIGFSYLTSFLLNKAGISFLDTGWSMQGAPPSHISIIPLWLALVAVGFASIVGIVSGAYPATRAMRLSPLEAIRNE
ncbi:MAG TPA: ABC transporter permease [Clostridiales bacterium]|nr:ABC transporter permease [Clostridiales bacterium]